MAKAPTPDAEVVVEGYGPGRVIEVRNSRAYVYVHDLELALEVELSALSAADGSGAFQPQSGRSELFTRGGPRLPVATEGLESNALASIEALRFGLVPSVELESLTLGFGDLKAWTQSHLPHSQGGVPQVSEICGQFGSGKSHTMAAIRHVAEQEGYVTARVEVDGTSISLSDPERLLFALWSSLSGKKRLSGTPLFDMCIKAVRAGHAAPSIAPRGIDRLHDNYSTARLIFRCNVADNFGHVLDSVMSSSTEFTASAAALEISRDPAIPALEVKVRRVIGQAVANRPYDFMEAWVGYAELARIAGYQGLVLTIDEFEVEHFLAGQKFNRVVALLDVVSSYFKGTLDHPRVPLAVFFATVGDEGHVGDAVVDALIAETGGAVRELKPWRVAQRKELARRIHDLYSAAYGRDDAFDSTLCDAVESQLLAQGGGDGVIRSFIKAYVGVLDSWYGPVRNGV